MFYEAIERHLKQTQLQEEHRNEGIEALAVLLQYAVCDNYRVYKAKPLQWQLNQRSEELHLSRSKLVSFSSRANKEMDDLFSPKSPAVEDSTEKEDAVLWVDEGTGSSRTVERSPSTHHPSSGDANTMNRLRCVPIDRLRSPGDEEPAVTQIFSTAREVHIEDAIWDTSQLDWSELSTNSEDESSSAPSDVGWLEEEGIWFYTPYSHKWYADPI